MRAFIFARSGSKGITDKNLADLGGKTLLKRAIEVALESTYIHEVVVSTDSERIASEAKACGAVVPFMRPDHLATDTSAELDSWKHALSFEWGDEFEPFLSVPVTSPLKTPEDIDAVITEYLNNDLDIVVSAMQPSHFPGFNLVEQQDGREWSLVKALRGQCSAHRQTSTRCLGLTTVCYAARKEFVKHTENILFGRFGVVEIPWPRSIDIDEPRDLDLARYYFGTSSERN